MLVMPPRAFSEQWEALRLRVNGFRSRLGAPDRTHSLFVLLWPLVALVIAILVIGRASTAKELSDLISALASLMWASVPIAILISFSQEIRAILSRIKKGKLFGMEFELDELQAKTEAAEVSVVAPEGDDEFYEHTITVGAAPAENEIEEVLREAARSPKLGLMLLSSKVERAIRELIADTPSNRRSALRPRAMAEALASGGQLSQETSQAVGLFLSVLNRIVHGGDADDDEIARAIDSGTRLLRLLLSRPRPSAETAKGPDGGD